MGRLKTREMTSRERTSRDQVTGTDIARKDIGRTTRVTTGKQQVTTQRMSVVNKHIRHKSSDSDLQFKV